MVCGTYLEENCPSTNRHLLDFGGVQKACQEGLWHLFYRRIFTGGIPFKMLKLGPKIGATECPFECGGGSNGYLGNAQMNRDIFMLGLP